MALQNTNNTETQPHNEKINDLHMTLCLFLSKFREMVLNMGYDYRTACYERKGSRYFDIGVSEGLY